MSFKEFTLSSLTPIKSKLKIQIKKYLYVDLVLLTITAIQTVYFFNRYDIKGKNPKWVNIVIKEQVL